MAAPLAIASGASQILGGLLGNIFSSGDKTRARQLAIEAYNELLKVGVPPDLSQELIFEQFKEAGVYTPELEQEIKLDISKVEQIKEDPSLRDAGIEALEQIREVSQSGLRPEDRAAFNQLRSEVSRDLQGKIGQIQQNFQARGTGGQGAELAAQLMASQEGANRMSAEGDRISSVASQRALEALSNSGRLASQLRSDDFEIAKAKAEAADEISKFNAQNALAIQSRNIAARNAAARMNLENKQRVMDANTAMRNNEVLRRNNARQDFWLNQMMKQKALADAKLGQASIYQGQAANTAQGWQRIGSGAAGLLNTFHQDNQQQKLFDLLKQRRNKPSFVDFNAEDNPFKFYS